MSQFASAWATISGKVFIEEWELKYAIVKRFPERIQLDIEKDVECTPDEMRMVFEELVKEKLFQLFPTHALMKISEIEVDLHSFHL